MSILNRNLMAFSKRIKAEMIKDCPRVYFREAAEKKIFPYVVYDIRVLSEIRVIFELDIWGIRDGELNLQKLADDLEEHLDGSIISDPLFMASIYTNNDLKWVTDEDKDIRHINMSFTCTYQG